VKQEDDATLLLRVGQRESELQAVRDSETMRIGAGLARLTQHPDWPLLEQKVEWLRNEIAKQILSGDKDQDISLIRGQAQGAKLVLDLVQNAILAAQEALGRMEEGRKASKVARETYESSGGLVGD
jgi:hypothetical protein